MCRTIKETDVLLLKCWFVVFQDKQVKQGGDLCLQVMLKDCIQAFTAKKVSETCLLHCDIRDSERGETESLACATRSSFIFCSLSL